MRHLHHRLIAVTGAAVVALLVAFAPTVSSGAQVEGASFFIEEIQLEGLRLVSERIVLAESLLEAGTTYSETELQHAVRRIRRLPSVLTVDFRLDRGTERGRYRLIISVGETRRFFFGLDLVGGYIESIDYKIHSPDVPGAGGVLCIGRDCFEDRFKFGGAGIRQPIGSTGVLWAAAQLRTVLEKPIAFELGYTQYDLWGSGAFASGRVAVNSNGNLWWYTLEAGIPVGGDHSLRLLVDGFEEKERFSYHESSVYPDGFWTDRQQHHLDLGLEWRVDSRDDPLFPTAGRLLSASLRYQERENERHYSLDPTRSDATESKSVFARLSGTWFRPLNRRNSLSWGAELRVGNSDVRDDYWNGTELLGPLDFKANTRSVRLHLGYLKTLWRPTASRNLSDLRWETTLSGRYGQARLNAGMPDFDWHEAGLASSLVLRNRWGVFRFSLLYRASDGDLR